MYHCRIFKLDYDPEKLPMFKTDKEQQAFYAALGRQVMYGMHGSEGCGESKVELVTAMIDPRGNEIDACYWPRVNCRAPENEHGYSPYVGSMDQTVDEFTGKIREKGEGRPFVIGAVLGADGVWGFHS